MSISINELNNIDFSDIAENAEISSPVTPGEILLDEFLKPLNLSATALAKALHVPPNRITGIINNQRSISADTALRLGIYFNMTPEFWLGIQQSYDLEKAEIESGNTLRQTIKPRSKAA